MDKEVKIDSSEVRTSALSPCFGLCMLSGDKLILLLDSAVGFMADMFRVGSNRNVICEVEPKQKLVI